MEIDPLALSDGELGGGRGAERGIGVVNTPAWAARWLAREALDAVAATRLNKTLMIVEPAAGSGVIVGAVAAELVRREVCSSIRAALSHIWAVDARRMASALAGRRLAKLIGRCASTWTASRYETGDALLDPSVIPKRPIDLIIGNPPYLGTRDAVRSPNYGKWSQRFGCREDLYAYFMRWAIAAVRPGGVVALLVPDGWMTLQAYVDLRGVLLGGQIRTIVRLPKATFDRHVMPCFLIWRKAAARGSVVRYVDSRSGSAGAPTSPAAYSPSRARASSSRKKAAALGGMAAALGGHASASIVSTSSVATAGGGPGRYAESSESPVEREIEQAAYAAAPGRVFFRPDAENLATARAFASQFARRSARRDHAQTAFAHATAHSPVQTLGDVALIQDVGIHSRNCRHRLFFADRVRPTLQRLLQGRQIEPYAVRWDSPKARYRWVDIHYVPKPGVRGRRGNGRASVRDEYWDWQGDPAVHRLPERILIRQTGDAIVAARCVQGRTAHYTDNTLFTATLTLEGRAAGVSYMYLLAYLNSAAATRLYRFLSQEERRPQAQIKVRLLRQLPFRVATAAQRREIERCAGLLEQRIATSRMGAFQQKIDRHFDQLLGFDPADMLASTRCVAGAR